ncbi:MAG: sensor histidine kinase, partial [Actinomycetota bacterium]|nr:sensor histidine kinase [Actinomycetota bacterium]
YGLVGMAERIAWVGGQFVVHSQPGEGTDLTAWVPLAPGRDGHAGSHCAVERQEARAEIAQPRAVPLGPGTVR